MDIVPYTQPKETLRILVVEDSDDDLELCLREIRKANLNAATETVRTKTDLAKRLLEGCFDVVIADYSLGGWTGIEALQLIRSLGKNIPFILLTGVLEDELAVDCIKQGASDYILKDRLARLPLAICRAVNESSAETQRRAALDKGREAEHLFHTLAESIDSAIFVYSGSKCLYANHQAEVITGYGREELLAMNSLNLIHPESREDLIRMGFRAANENSSKHCEVKITAKGGEIKYLHMTSKVIDMEGKLGRLVTAYDITELRAAGEETRRLATTDPLTGLANYRRLVSAFESECARSQRSGRPFSLMLMDLDELEKINDLYGHEVGSRALCRVGGAFNRSAGALICRPDMAATSSW